MLAFASIKCYNMTCTLSCWNTTRLPLSASSSSIARMSLWFLSVLMSSVLSCSTTITSSTLGLFSSNSVCVSVFLMVSGRIASFSTLISVSRDSTFSIAGHKTTSETFCHKTCRKFVRLISCCCLRATSADEGKKKLRRRLDDGGFGH